MSKNIFIKTSDDETKNKLIELGYILHSKDGEIYTFLNNQNLSFNDKDLKITYSNMLTI